MSLTRKQYELIERRLLKVAEKITKRPERYNQNAWCGTTCCIAGHLDGGYLAPKSDDRKVIEKAHALIFVKTTPWLFLSAYLWPKDLSEAFSKAHGGRDAGKDLRVARVGVRAIKRYLAERRKEVGR